MGLSTVLSNEANNVKVIPVRLIAQDNDEIIKGLPVHRFIQYEIKTAFIYNWESCHKYSFENFYE